MEVENVEDGTGRPPVLRGLLTVVALLLAEHGLQELQLMSSVVWLPGSGAQNQ